MAALWGGFVHDNIASQCTEARKWGVVQVMVNLEKTVWSLKSRKLGFDSVMEPESEGIARQKIKCMQGEKGVWKPKTRRKSIRRRKAFLVRLSFSKLEEGICTC